MKQKRSEFRIFLILHKYYNFFQFLDAKAALQENINKAICNFELWNLVQYIENTFNSFFASLLNILWISFLVLISLQFKSESFINIIFLCSSKFL